MMCKGQVMWTQEQGWHDDGDIVVMPRDRIGCPTGRASTVAVHVTADGIRRPICARCGINHSHNRLVWADHDAVQIGAY